MKIFVLGLNYKNASLSVREKLAFDSEQTLQALKLLKKSFQDAEFVLLSTCNRVELYCACERDNPIETEKLVKFLSDFHNVNSEEFREFLFVLTDEDAVRHLLTVASSLDSQVIGEAQIFNQVKESYKLACQAKSTGKILNRLFHCSFSTGKKVFSATSISQGKVSIAGIAVELAKQLFEDISSAKVTVIGAGEMGELIVQHLIKSGCEQINIINRSYERALEVANRYKVSAIQWAQINEQLQEADIIISSAAVKDYLYTKETFETVIKRRKKKNLLIIDIGVPRNMEPSLSEIEGVHLYSIEDLSQIIQKNRKAREKDISMSMEIIDKEVDVFIQWLLTREIGPLIGKLSEQFSQISQAEMDRFFVGIRHEASCRDVLEMTVNRIVNKLLHCVIENVNTVAKEASPLEAEKLIDRIVKHAEAITSETSGPKDSDL